MTARRPAHEAPDASERDSAATAIAPQGRASSSPAARRWRSAELFGRDHEVEIEHGQAVYRLRMTALGKLILTK